MECHRLLKESRDHAMPSCIAFYWTPEIGVCLKARRRSLRSKNNCITSAEKDEKTTRVISISKTVHFDRLCKEVDTDPWRVNKRRLHRESQIRTHRRSPSLICCRRLLTLFPTSFERCKLTHCAGKHQ